MEKIVTKVNLAWAALVTVLSAALGKFWWVFVAFAILNVVDYFTGWLKAHLYGKVNSMAGLKGIIKKLCYWLTIGIAFFISVAFTELGKEIGVDFGFSIFIGWFTFITFIINELRSVLENVVELGVTLPAWLVKGLEVANDKINNIASDGTTKPTEERKE